jgi:hypothetical protein
VTYPQCQHLQRVQSGEPFPAEPDDTFVDEFTSFVHTFAHTLTESLRLPVYNKSPTFGFDLRTDGLNVRVFVEKIRNGSPASKIRSTPKATNNALCGAYHVAVNDVLVFSKEQAVAELRKAFDAEHQEISLVFAPEERLTAAQLRAAVVEHQEPDVFSSPDQDDDDTPVLTLDALRPICALRFPDSDFSSSSIPAEDIACTIHAVTSSAITQEEQALGFFTRGKLKRLSIWSEWQEGEFRQLERMKDLYMFGAPVPPPRNTILLRMHWQNHIKRSSERRSRSCCDGSPQATPMLHQVASTYSSCVEQPVQRLFFALAAANDLKVLWWGCSRCFSSLSPSGDSDLHHH